MITLNHNKKAGTSKASASRPEMHGDTIHRVSTDPFLDWVMILVAALVLTLALVGVGIYVYLEAGVALQATPQASKGQALPLDQKKLGRVLSDFDSRSSRTSALMRSYNAPRDPSLP